MDRHVLDALYRASPVSAFRRALGGERLDAATFSFLHAHAYELDFEFLIVLLRKPLADDVDRRVEPFVRRLADAIASGGVLAAIRALDLSRVLDADAWADLTRRLRGHLPNALWYSFVDRVRGGRIFNALNEPPPYLDPKDFLGPVAQSRPEPLVVRLLEEPTNDLNAAAYVLTLPMNVVFRVHERVPDLVRLEDVQSIAPCRVTAKDEQWVPPFPEWMAPHVVERIRLCKDDEALDLYQWLSAQRPGSHQGDLFDIALARFRLVPLSREWHRLIGKHLTTGMAWRTRGRAVVEFCVEYNRGFPPALLTAALGAATAQDGASTEKHRAAILRSTHDVTARVLVEQAEKAMRSGEWDASRRLLSSLASLDPGSFISGPVHRLRKIPDLPEDVLRLIEACERLASSGGRAPSESAIDEAFLVLSGSLS